MGKTLVFLLLISGAAVGVYFYFDKKKNLQTQSSVKVNKLDVNPGILTTQLIFDITITNPSNSEQKIDSVTADVVYNNIPFGKINYLKPINIAPVSSTNIQVKLDESNIDLLKNFPDLLSSSLSGIKVLVDGFYNTSLGAVPFSSITTVI